MTRKRKQRLFLIFLTVCLVFAIVGAASGQTADCNPFNPDGTVKKTNECQCSDQPTMQSFCMTGTEYLAATLGQMVQKAFFSLAENLAGLFWLLARWAALLAEFALQGEVWTLIRETILGLLESIMGGSGGVLDQIVRGADGLLYLALVVAGIALIVPFAALSGQAPVKIERVVVWAVFLIALFIAGTQGFDLISMIEELRVGFMQTIIDTESLQLSDLVAAPMGATIDETLTIPEDDALALPAAYQAEYFPDIKNAQPWRFRVLVIASNTNLLEVVTAGELVQEEEMQARAIAAVAGVIRAGMALIPAYVLLLVAIILMMLSAASLVLIVFFVAALPLGFFEFGATVLGGLARQYIGVVTVSLFAAVFIRILGELGSAIFGSDFSLAGMVVYTGGLGIVIIALHAGVKQAWKALSGSTDILQTSVASIGNVSGSGQIPGIPVEAAKGTLNTAVSTAAAVGLGAMTGGIGVGLAAGAGQMFGGSSAGRSTAVAMAAARPDSQASQAFATGALTRGSLPHLAGGLVANRQRSTTEVDKKAAQDKFAQEEMQKGTTAAQVTKHDQDRLHLAPQWQGPQQWLGTQQAGAYLTPDLQALERAEQAFFDHDDPQTAEAELAHALGDRELARQVIQTYEREGQEAADQVRGVVERTQAVAAHSESIVGPDGRLDRDYQEERDKLVKGMPGQAAHSSLRTSVAKATIRQVAAVRDLSPAMRTTALIHSIQQPEDPVVQVGDTAAQYQLHDLAARRGWDKEQLEAIFEQEAAAPLTSTRKRQTQIAETLHADPAFAGARVGDLMEAGRLAEMVSDTAYVQVPVGSYPVESGEWGVVRDRPEDVAPSEPPTIKEDVSQGTPERATVEPEIHYEDETVEDLPAEEDLSDVPPASEPKPDFLVTTVSPETKAQTPTDFGFPPEEPKQPTTPMQAPVVPASPQGGDPKTAGVVPAQPKPPVQKSTDLGDTVPPDVPGVSLQNPEQGKQNKEGKA